MSSEMRVTDEMVDSAVRVAVEWDGADAISPQVMRAALHAALLARTEAGADGADGAVESNGPEFTDWARAALSWVLYHHQGGSSPVGQPIRFALGMGANERLPDWRQRPTSTPTPRTPAGMRSESATTCANRNTTSAGVMSFLRTSEPRFLFLTLARKVESIKTYPQIILALARNRLMTPCRRRRRSER
jgi:hypothetical protein